MLDANEQTQLLELWNARRRATEADWTRLYRLVERALVGCGSTLLASIDADRASLVHDFFYQKVFLTADREREPLQHAAALCGFFRNYLRDRWRAYASTEGRTVALDESRASDAEAGAGDSSLDEAAEQVHADVDPAMEALLAEAGVPVGRLADSVERFLDELGRDDETFVLYLKLHLCPDEPVPLSKLAQLYRIPSYHYRAERLGITGKKSGFARGYEKTLIGQWLVGLGLRIEPSFAREIVAAFAYLCAGALARLVAEPGQAAA
jgi:hypothetical protein